MKTISEIKLNNRIIIQQEGVDGGCVDIFFSYQKEPAFAIFSFGGGWDHVSASFRKRCPTWEEMCTIKDIFFNPDECAVQYHPAKSEYINRFPHCLHIWKPQNVEIPMPPKEFV